VGFSVRAQREAALTWEKAFSLRFVFTVSSVTLEKLSEYAASSPDVDWQSVVTLHDDHFRSSVPSGHHMARKPPFML
jgi:hypothetical protein